jgi:tRNA(adenine34) deaminase
MIGVSAAEQSAMRLAIDEAAAASVEGEIPIGAVVIGPDDSVIARAHNERETSHDPTAHAEVLALRSAAQRLGRWRLDDCTLVVTLEPCPMCAGAVVISRIPRLVFGAWNEEYGAAGSRWDLVRDRRLSRRTEVIGGLMAEECGAMVRTFLEAQRPVREVK